MRVLHVIPSLGPLRGGPSVAVPLLARAQVRAGLEVDIATTDDNGPDAHLVVPLETPMDDQGVTIRYFRRQTRFYTASWPLTRWLASNVGRYDVVHIHALFSYAAAPAALLAARSRVPYVVRPLGTLTRWGMEQRRPMLKNLSFSLIERRILDAAAAVHYTSRQERDEASQLGVKASPAIVPLGLNLDDFQDPPPRSDFFRAHPTLEGRPIVLFLSRVDPKKGLDLLLPAFAAVKDSCPNAALVIAGSGEDGFVEGLRRRADGLGLSGSVAWVGFLEGSEKLAAFSAADVYVLPSYSENFGVAPVEAMAAGVPVLVSDQVGVAPDVVETNSGVVVPCAVDPLAAALRNLLERGDLRSQLAANASRAARERFSSEATAIKLQDLYAGILGVQVPVHA